MSGTAENYWAYSERMEQFDMIVNIIKELNLLPGASEISSTDVIAPLQKVPAEKLIKFSRIPYALEEHKFMWGPVLERECFEFEFSCQIFDFLHNKINFQS